MTEIRVSEYDFEDHLVDDWRVQDEAELVSAVVQRAAEAGAGAPFYLPRGTGENKGAYITVDDEPRFLSANDSQIIDATRRLAVEDTITNRVRACIAWVEQHNQRRVNFDYVSEAAPSSPAYAALRAAEKIVAELLERAVKLKAAGDEIPIELLHELGDAIAERGHCLRGFDANLKHALA